MKLFGYYALHTLINQIRKLMKTWVLVFLLVCVVMGGLIGFGAASLSGGPEDAPEEMPEIQEEISVEEALGISGPQLAELVCSGLILAVFVFCAFSADKNGSRIFLPADVNLLFASPMKPQSVLMFRLVTRMGMALFASLYFFLILGGKNLGFWPSVSLLTVWVLTVGMGQLLQVLLYTVCSSRPAWKLRLRYCIYGVLALLGVGFFLYWKQSGQPPLVAAAALFCHPASRLVPLWGWLKGVAIFTLEGNILGACLCFGGTVAAGIGIAWLIWHVKADFYEDAMAKSQETAARMEQLQAEKPGILRRKKDRSDRLLRDGLNRGEGAAMFFHKALYNRFRFAHLHIFTKTSEIYLAFVLAVGLLCRFVVKTDAYFPAVLTLAALAFFRALGNPLGQDTGMDFFRMIPENTWKKLFFSLMGGTVNCLLDLLPPMAVILVLLKISPVTALLWILFILTMDLFSASVATFIDLSVPVSAGKTVKQLVQILFIYFGLLPDIAIFAVGFSLEQPYPAALLAAAVNIGLGMLFLGLCPLFLEPKDGKKFRPEVPFTGDLPKIRRLFSRMGGSIFLIFVLGTLLQLVLGIVIEIFDLPWLEHPWGIWLLTFLPLYGIAVPAGVIMLHFVPKTPLPQHGIRLKQLAMLFPICIFLMYAGNLTGIAVTAAIQAICGIAPENPLLNFAADAGLFQQLLFFVILAPVIEEFLFRKLLIDRMHIYGGKTAVILTALIFGLFHGNLAQFFYAFALGLVFGFVYLKTGQLRWSISLHMALNFLGGVVGPWFAKAAMQENIETAADLQKMIGLGLYVLVILVCAGAGLVLLCIKKRKISFAPAPVELPKGQRLRTCVGNTGMLLLILGCLFLFATTFFPSAA